jgi:hypothetical protein
VISSPQVHGGRWWSSCGRVCHLRLARPPQRWKPAAYGLPRNKVRRRSSGVLLTILKGTQSRSGVRAKGGLCLELSSCSSSVALCWVGGDWPCPPIADCLHFSARSTSGPFGLLVKRAPSSHDQSRPACARLPETRGRWAHYYCGGVLCVSAGRTQQLGRVLGRAGDSRIG